MTYENLLVSIIVALTTAFITAILSNHYWIRQLHDKEKSTFRTAFLENKLKVYENLMRVLAECANTISHLKGEYREKRADYEKRLDDIIHRLYILIISDVIYMHPDILNHTVEIFTAYNELLTALKNTASVNDKDRETIKEEQAKIIKLIREDIGFDKLLHDKKWRKAIGIDILSKIEKTHK